MSTHPALERAERYLETAAAMIELGDIESSISRSYYAMFYVVRALLAEKGITPKTHSGMRNQSGLHMVKAGLVSKRYAALLDTAEEL